MQRLLPFTSWLAVIMVVAGCGNVRAPDGPGRSSTDVSAATGAQRIVAGVRGAPQAFSQLRDGTPSASITGLRGLQELTHAGLVHSDNRGNLLPQLAEAVPSLENGL